MGTRNIVGIASLLLAALVPATVAVAAFPGANGRIAFQGFQSLGTTNASGGDRKPLLSAGTGVFFGGPTWSPDGQRIAFSSNRDGADAEIYVTSADGATVTQLTDNTFEDNAPTWSPDGQRIAFESDRSGQSLVWVMNRDGTGVVGTAVSIAEDWAPSWSPDGARIAFARGPDGARNIWVMGADGANPTALTSDAADETNPDWSPNGSRIAFQRGDAIVVMSADGGGQTPLSAPAGAARPAWAPDGTKIAFDVVNELYAINADGTGVTPLTSGGSSTLFTKSPSWQPIPAPAPPPPTPPGTDPGLVDADGDGAVASVDCNDADSTIRPGAKDKPGDKIDQNCNGRDAALPVLDRRIGGFWATYPGGYTKFTALTVKPARKGDRVKLSCKGPGCRGKGKTVKVRKNARTLSVLKHLRGAELRKGAVVQLRVTRPGAIGRVNTWKIRAPKAPQLVRRCVKPGAKKASRCPG